MHQFYRISHGWGQDKKVIIANNIYEALGYYLLEVHEGVFNFLGELDIIEKLPPDHYVEVSCLGYREYRTLMEIYEEMENCTIPQVIAELE
jgi:hypothetical protein